MHAGPGVLRGVGRLRGQERHVQAGGAGSQADGAGPRRRHPGGELHPAHAQPRQPGGGSGAGAPPPEQQAQARGLLRRGLRHHRVRHRGDAQAPRVARQDPRGGVRGAQEPERRPRLHRASHAVRQEVAPAEKRQVYYDSISFCN